MNRRTLTPRQALERSIREEDVEHHVISACEAFGWLRYHTHDSRHSPAGFPDEVLLRPPRLIFAELKRVGRKPEPAQQQWLDLLDLVPNVERYVWTPADLDDIDRILR